MTKSIFGGPFYVAHRIKAINTYRPRIEQGNTVQRPELVRAPSRATGLEVRTSRLDIHQRNLSNEGGQHLEILASSGITRARQLQRDSADVWVQVYGDEGLQLIRKRTSKT